MKLKIMKYFIIQHKKNHFYNKNLLMLYRTIIIIIVFIYYQLLLLIMTVKLNYNNINMSNILLGTRSRRRSSRTTTTIMVYSYTLKPKLFDQSNAIVWKKHMSSSITIAQCKNRNHYIMMRQFVNYNRMMINPITIQRRIRQLQHQQQYTTSTMMSLSLSSSSSSFDDTLKDDDTNKQQSDYSLLQTVDGISSGTDTNNEQQQQANLDETSQNENHNQSYHQRRIRYTGKYPRNFHEKYKELHNDTITIQKKLLKGITPAGQHIPIMIDECMYHLGFSCNNNNNDNITTTTTTTKNTSIDPIIFVDCTLGYGGHSMEILRYILQQQQQLQQDSHHHHRMICFDQDPIELPKATERLYNIIQSSTITTKTTIQPQDIVTTVHSNFRNLRTYIENSFNVNINNKNGTGVVTSLLADLGLSSMQIDDASRGFTYKYDGPLDMRMNTTSTIDNNNNNNNNTTTTTMTAYDLLCNVSVSELTRIIHENSDEEYASIIAKAIVGTSRNKNKDNIPTTTVELANRVRDTVRPYLLQKTGTPATANKSKQNKNINSKNDKQPQQQQQVPLKRDSAIMKKQLDTIVKRVMQAIRIEINHEFDSLQQLLDDLPYILKSPGGKAVILTFHSGEDRRVKKAFKDGYKKGIYSQWSRDVVRPSSNEQYNNPRSTCCKLRWVIRSDQTI